MGPNASNILYSYTGKSGCRRDRLPTDVKRVIKDTLSTRGPDDNVFFFTRQDSTHSIATPVGKRSKRKPGPCRIPWHLTMSYVNKSNKLIIADTQYIHDRYVHEDNKDLWATNFLVQKRVHLSIKDIINDYLNLKLKKRDIVPIIYRNKFW